MTDGFLFSWEISGGGLGRKEETKIFNYLLMPALCLAITSLNLYTNLPQEVNVILIFVKEESIGRQNNQFEITASR